MTAATLVEKAQAKLDAKARQIANVEPEPVLRQLDYFHADQLSDTDDTFDDELIEGTIGRIAMVVLYGDSNSGKTFLAVEMGHAVALGQDWLGRRTSQGLVLYLATEAAESVRMRVRARRRHTGEPAPGLVVVTSPVNFFDGVADVSAVISLVDAIETELQGKVVLIVADTLARISAGANENNGQDMGVVLKHADALRLATGATFLWVHHTGKDAAKGMRGWSGMRAAIDTEIEVTADEATGLRSAEITKQRDLPGKGDRIGFRLLPVPMGVNRWGTERTSCVVAASDAPEKRARGRRVSEIAGAITELLTQHGTGMLRGHVVKHFEGRYTSSAVYRELKSMATDGRLIEGAGVVAMPGKPTVAGVPNGAN